MIVEYRLNRLARLASSDKEKRFDRLFRELTKPDFLSYAYEQIKTNKGSKTPGVDGLTKFSWDEKSTNNLAEQLKTGHYEPHPVRRVLIDKKNKPGQKRPLGIPTFADRIVQSGIKLILEALYEPIFMDCSNGFRPHRACQTALVQICDSPSVRIDWVIEGDIKGCFDNICHQKLLLLLQKRVKDDRFLKLIGKFLRAGYFERERWNPTKAGTPQGGIVSPILANIFLHEMDKYVCTEYRANQTTAQSNREISARTNPEWVKVQTRLWRLRGMLNGKLKLTAPKEDVENEVKHLLKFRATIPNKIQPIKSRITYARYADDFVISLRNMPKSEAERIKSQLTQWLQDELHLVLSPEKTAITHINDGFKFLGYKIMSKKTDSSQPRVKLAIPYESAQSTLKKIKEICRNLGAPETEVIHKVNNILRGWMMYYRSVSAPSRIMCSVLSHTWFIYGDYVSRKKRCRISQAAQRWIERCPSSSANPKGGQKSWMAETIDEKGKMVKEYLLCVPVQKRGLFEVARKIRQEKL